MDDGASRGPLADLIQRVAGHFLEHPVSKAARLHREWSRCVGARVARHSEPQTLRNGLLTVRVDSSVWLTELTYLAPGILEKLRERLPPDTTLREIRFKQGSLRTVPPWLQEKPAAPALPPSLPEERERAVALTAPITDPALREVMTRLFITDQVAKRHHASRKE
ncbi:MAG: DUF721 domain-containing protein [Magnetococcales bacterium]|nr:DUF721 domain-containing protein [Magnetococcales bacterium]